MPATMTQAVTAIDRDDVWTHLMTAALRGDEAAYRSILEALAVFVRSEARRGFTRYGHGSADVDDVVQETLLAIHLKRETWQPERPVGPWVRAIARNKVIDTLRRKGRHVSVPIDDFADRLPAAPSAERLTHQDAAQALKQLQGRQREIVQSISINGNSIRETAARYAISEGAVRVALHRGLATLARANQAGCFL